MQKTLVLIHTGTAFAPAFTDLSKELLPDVRLFHMVDESLLKNTIASGKLEKVTIRRLMKLVESAAATGADVVLVTCSTIGPAVPVIQPLFDFPVLRIDEPMADVAVRIGHKAGVIATLGSTLEPTTNLIREAAARRQSHYEVITCLCEGAFDALMGGDPQTHDRLVLAKVQEFMAKVDVIVLAQASMARVIQQIPMEERKVPIVSSPRLAMQRVKDVLASL